MRHEDRIKEQRTIEATKKKLMGAGGKIGTVLRHLGQAIIDQSEGGVYADTHYLDDPWALPDERESPFDLPQGKAEDITKKIPFFKQYLPWGEEQKQPEGPGWMDRPDGVDYQVNTIGYHFDGLSRGMHLEIQYLDGPSELVVHFKGFLVFREVKGELTNYVPHESWEALIDQLYVPAKKLAREKKEKVAEEELAEAKKAKASWFEEMRKRWGL